MSNTDPGIPSVALKLEGGNKEKLTTSRINLRGRPESPRAVEKIPRQELKRTGPGRLIDIIGKETRHVIGIMSGTSVDALDIVLVTVSGFGADTVAHQVPGAFSSYPWPKDIRTRIFRLFKPEISIKELCQLNFLWSEVVAQFVLQFLGEHGYEPNDIDIVSTAGQTVWHEPNPTELMFDGLEIHTSSTFAIGLGAVIAERTGILTVSNLRVRDVAAGGQGAPITPFSNWKLFQEEHVGICIQNIGGIANLTYIPPKPAGLNNVFAFDTGPGNMIIDALAEMIDERMSCDENGAFAARGKVREELLQKLLEHPYFKLPIPKSTGREVFGKQFAQKLRDENPELSLFDLISTATAFTAESMAMSYEETITSHGRRLDKILICGGGGQNPALMDMLRARCKAHGVNAKIEVMADSQAMEAVAMAIIADATVRGEFTNVPGATGGRPTILGDISY